MPRGNDPSATRDLANQYGEGHGNAEDLIAHHDNVLLDPELQKALSKAVDPAATDALDLSTVKPKHGGTIMSAVIRGGRLVAVEDVDGHYVKWHDDIPGSGGSRSRGSGRVDSGAQGRKDQAARGQADNPSGDPDKNDGGTGADGSGADGGNGGNGDGEDDSTEAPEGVTVPMIRAKLEALQIVPARDVRRKDDLWALLPEDAQADVQAQAAGGTTPPS